MVFLLNFRWRVPVRRLCVPGNILANRLCVDVVNLLLIMSTWTQGNMFILQIPYFLHTSGTHVSMNRVVGCIQN